VFGSNGQPVPFANIQIPGTETSAYTDARGNFRLASADSVLMLEFKSVGYENKSIPFSAAQPRMDIQLLAVREQDKKTRMNPESAGKDNRVAANTEKKESTADGAEPADGWSAYQNYLFNNVRIPRDRQDQRLQGTVTLSFLVDKQGRRSDFRIEQSLHPVYDLEAIRLVREGPGWQLRNSEKLQRASVTVVF
jgi:TonB family protein